MRENLLEWGIALILILQGSGDWFVGPLNLFTFTGNVEFYLLIAPAIYWCIDRRLGFRAAMMVMLSLGLNEILKIAFHRPRPYWFDPRVRLLSGAENTFGLPSGHAQHSVILWGGIAAAVQQWWVWGLVVLFSLLVGLSRIFLGVHFPADVVVGWGLGMGLLFIILRVERPVVAQINRLDISKQIVLFFLLSLLIVTLGSITVALVTAFWSLPYQWVDFALLAAPAEPINPLSPENLVTVAGVFFGFASGAKTLDQWGGFVVPGHWLKKAGRYGVGVVGVLILWLGLRVLFGLVTEDETLLGYILRYIRYGLVGGWMSALAPLVFIKLRLAERESKF